MKIAFFSNFLNHHQLPLCQEFLKQDDVEFVFIATEEMPDSRSQMRYEDMNQYPFVVRAYESEEAKAKAQAIADECDMVIWGAAPFFYVKKRIEENKITFRFCERLFKKGLWRRFLPSIRQKIYHSYIQYREKNLYVLGASSYAAYDFVICGFPQDKCFRWGYFPKIEEKNLPELFELKNQNAVPEILYAGRLLPLKHVMDTVKAVKNLKKQGVAVHFTIIGDGECKSQIERYIRKNKLYNEITLLPFMPSKEVRAYMDKSDIFVFGSSFYEGWGAVMNEAMNSACAVLVSHAVGSAAYLIDHAKNGYIYPFANVKRLTKHLKALVLSKELRQEFGTQAYRTITKEWTAEEAAKRLLCVSQAIENRKNTSLYSTGPVSLAKF